MHGLKVLSRVGLVFTALLLSGCDPDDEERYSEYFGLTPSTSEPQREPVNDSENFGPRPSTSEPQRDPVNDVEQPVSDLKAEFHFSNTFGCPFMQVVDVAGAADNADVSLKLSIDGTPVEHSAEFITEGEYVEEGFDGYFDLVAGDDFKTELEGEHTLQVEVSDGVGSVTIEGKFTADSCPPN